MGMTMALKEMVQFILIKAYLITTKCCAHGAKSYIIWEEFTASMCLLVQSR